MTEKDLREMKIGQSIFDDTMGYIHRTIGGWIYLESHVFVPDDKTENEPKRGRKPVLKQRGINIIPVEK